MIKDDFVKDILNARFDATLIAGSSDAIILEQEALYLLLLSSNGVPVPKCLSVDTPKHGHADSVKQFIPNSVQRIGITPQGDSSTGGVLWILRNLMCFLERGWNPAILWL